MIPSAVSGSIKGVVDQISVFCSEFTWELIFWYQWLSFQRGTLNLKDYYSPEERELIKIWSETSVLGFPDSEVQFSGTDVEEILLSRCKEVAETLMMTGLDTVGEPEKDFLSM
jgi:hypothetical protein